MDLSHLIKKTSCCINHHTTAWLVKLAMDLAALHDNYAELKMAHLAIFSFDRAFPPL